MLVKKVCLKPIKSLDELIKAYCVWHNIEHFSSEVNDKIKDVASDNLWLLAYLLEGLRKADGQGDPSQWLKDGILHKRKECRGT